MEFDNKFFEDNKLYEIQKIRIEIPVDNAEALIFETANKELIHIYLNKNSLLDHFNGNPDHVYERIFLILLESDEVPIEEKCFYENWIYKLIEFKVTKKRICNMAERKIFILNKEEKILERINGNRKLAMRDYLKIINKSPEHSISSRYLKKER